MRVPLTARRSNQSLLKEISPEYSLEGLMLKLKLKLQYFGHFMQTEEEKMETVTDFLFIGSKITAYSDCRHEIKDACSLEAKL